MKQIRLKDKVLKIESCENCPCSGYEEKQPYLQCNILGIYIIDGKRSHGMTNGILENCPLEDYDDFLEKAKQALDETCDQIKVNFKAVTIRGSAVDNYQDGVFNATFGPDTIVIDTRTFSCDKIAIIAPDGEEKTFTFVEFLQMVGLR